MKLWNQFLNIFRIPDLRRKVLFTLGILALCRVGVYVPLPGVDVSVLGDYFKSVQGQPGGQILGLVNLFAGGALSRGAIFGLGIMPYISASIIFQLLASVVPSLERLQKEGEAGRKKINQYTRIATVFICLFQGAVLVRGLYGFQYGGQAVVPDIYRETWWASFRFLVLGGFLLTAGTMFLMWLGEQIDEHGIGNGISLIIMINIIDRLPSGFLEMYMKIQTTENRQDAVLKLLVMLALFIAVIVAIVYITQGQRRIPIQQAKHVRGQRVYGGQRQYLPLRVNQSGVMPIIFANALLMFPAMIAGSLARAMQARPDSVLYRIFTFISDAVSPGRGLTVTYIVLYGLLIFFFCYFWTAITFNPKEMSENMKDHGSFIPGIRPGKRTANYLEDIMVRITLAGSMFLIAIAIMPQIVSHLFGVGYSVAGFYGGTSILIVVGVALDAVQRVEQHLLMRHYGGFSEGGVRRRRRRYR
jgi:preprotein translocase subunit SecY